MASAAPQSSSRVAGHLSRVAAFSHGTASGRQGLKPRPQRVHSARGLVDVVHMKAGRDIGGDSPQKLLQPPSVTGASVLADHEAGLLFVAPIPRNRLVARE